MFGTENQSLQKNRKEIFGKKNKLSTTEAAHFNTGKEVSCAVCWAKNLSAKKRETLRNTLAVFLRTPMIPSENITICWLRSFLPEKKCFSRSNTVSNFGKESQRLFFKRTVYTVTFGSVFKKDTQKKPV